VPQFSGEAHYSVTIFDNRDGARVRVCFEGNTIEKMVPIAGDAGRNLVGAWQNGVPLPTERGRIVLGQNAPSTCIEYETRFARGWFRGAKGDPVITSQKQWLWRPEPFPDDLEVSLRFVAPPQTQVSVPWPQKDGVYFPNQSAFFMDAYVVFGDVEHLGFDVAGTRIDVALLGNPPPKDDVRQWIDTAVRTVASVGARFPRDRLHFVVKPVDSPGAQVAFGMVRRGGGASVLLLPSVHATAGPLERDWVAVHELSHLWLPSVYLEGRWLSEGIATYLQEVLRARCGLQTSARAWRRLREGFDRGRRSGTRRPLSAESRNMHRTGAYQRVYWAGAAFALEADVRLRVKSGGEQTLFTALDRAQASWADEPGPVEASEVLRALDEATGARLFRDLGRVYGQQSSFPDTSQALSPDLRSIRAQIMAPSEDACTISVGSRR